MSAIIRKIQTAIHEHKAEKIQKEIDLKEALKSRLQAEIVKVNAMTTTEVRAPTLSGRLTTLHLQSLDEEDEVGHNEDESDWVYVPTQDRAQKIANLSEEIEALKEKLALLQPKKS
jgi:hypothetical protein